MERQVSDIQRLRARLLARGITLADFSRMHGFKTDTVYKNVRRYYGRGTRPWGTVALEIIRRLEEYAA